MEPNLVGPSVEKLIQGWEEKRQPMTNGSRGRAYTNSSDRDRYRERIQKIPEKNLSGSLIMPGKKFSASLDLPLTTKANEIRSSSSSTLEKISLTAKEQGLIKEEKKEEHKEAKEASRKGSLEEKKTDETYTDETYKEPKEEEIEKTREENILSLEGEVKSGTRIEKDKPVSSIDNLLNTCKAMMDALDKIEKSKKGTFGSFDYKLMRGKHEKPNNLIEEKKTEDPTKIGFDLILVKKRNKMFSLSGKSKSTMAALDNILATATEVMEKGSPSTAFCLLTKLQKNPWANKVFFYSPNLKKRCNELINTALTQVVEGQRDLFEKIFFEFLKTIPKLQSLDLKTNPENYFSSAIFKEISQNVNNIALAAQIDILNQEKSNGALPRTIKFYLDLTEKLTKDKNFMAAVTILAIFSSSQISRLLNYYANKKIGQLPPESKSITTNNILCATTLREILKLASFIQEEMKKYQEGKTDKLVIPSFNVIQSLISIELQKAQNNLNDEKNLIEAYELKNQIYQALKYPLDKELSAEEKEIIRQKATELQEKVPSNEQFERLITVTEKHIEDKKKENEISANSIKGEIENILKPFLFLVAPAPKQLKDLLRSKKLSFEENITHYEALELLQSKSSEKEKIEWHEILYLRWNGVDPNWQTLEKENPDELGNILFERSKNLLSTEDSKAAAEHK